MAETLDLSALIAQAEAAGADFKKVRVEPGPYVVKIVNAKYNESKAGNPGFSVQTEILQGVHTGKRFWSNFYLTPTKKNGEQNTAGVQIFFRNLAALGVATEEFKTRQTTVEQVIQQNRLVNVVATANVEDDDFGDEVSSKVKTFKALPAQAAAVPPVAAPVQPPVSAPPVEYQTPAPPPVSAPPVAEPF